MALGGNGFLVTTGLLGVGLLSASTGGAVGVACFGVASNTDGTNSCLSQGLGAFAAAGSGTGAETAIQIQSAVDNGSGNVINSAPKTFTNNSTINGIAIAAGNTAIAEGDGAIALAGSGNGGGVILQVQSVVLNGDDNTVNFAPQTATADTTFDGIAIAIGNTAIAEGSGAFAAAGSGNGGEADVLQLQQTTLDGPSQTADFAPQIATVTATFTGISVAIGNTAVADGSGSVAVAGSFDGLLDVVVAAGNSAHANGAGSIAISGSGDVTPPGLLLALGNTATANGTGAIAISGSFTNGGIENTATATASTGSLAIATAGSG